VAEATQELWRAPTADLYHRRGWALAALGWRALARADYERALRLDPAHAPSLFMRAGERMRLGDFAGAVEGLSRVADDTPRGRGARLYRSVALWKLGREKEAAEDRAAFRDVLAWYREYAANHRERDDPVMEA
jgi:lipoprotein NlpI